RAEGRDWRVATAGEGQRAVDLVGDDRETTAQADLGQPRQLLAREDAADRVVRVAQEEEARPLADPGREGVEVDFVAPVGTARQRRLLAREPDTAGRSENRRIDRRLAEQPVAGRRKDAAGQAETRAEAR